MRVVIQRVQRASVTVDDQVLASIGRGLAILAGVARGDSPEVARKLARKTAELRIFPDEAGRFNLSPLEVGGEALVISQFTLLADTRRGHRPSFTEAAPPEEAKPVIEAYIDAMREMGMTVGTGRFGAHMLVELANDGPVTIVLDTADLGRPRRR